MEITRRCDYACRIIRAAYQQKDSFCSIAQVAQEEDIPYSFARSIQHELVKAGILKTSRGVRGGLMLNCDPTQTTLKEVVEAVLRSNSCSFNVAWCGLDALIDSYLSSITLFDLFELKENHPVICEALHKKKLS